MKTVNEPFRAWAWHIARAAVILIVAAAIVAAGSAFLLTTAYAIAGHGSWLIPGGFLVAAVVAAGTVTWWRAGKARP